MSTSQCECKTSEAKNETQYRESIVMYLEFAEGQASGAFDDNEWFRGGLYQTMSSKFFGPGCTNNSWVSRDWTPFVAQLPNP